MPCNIEKQLEKQDDKLQTVAVVPVRLTSKRLPCKHFKLIGKKTVLDWVIHRLKSSQLIDLIVLCAPDESESIMLGKVAVESGVELYIYQGDTNDVVGRLTSAARKYNADICVLASGDCPLLSTTTIDKMIQMLKINKDAGHITFDSIHDTTPIHEGIVISRLWVWEQAEKYSDTPYLREHHFPVFLHNVYPHRFENVKVLKFKDEEVFYKVHHRISVDTPSDLQFMNTIYNNLQNVNVDFTLENTVELLLKNPILKNINSGVYQKKVYDIGRLFLFVVLKEYPAIYDNILSIMEAANILMNEYGAGIRFLIEDSKVADMVEKRGFFFFEGSTELLKSVYEKFSFDTIAIVSSSENQTLINFKEAGYTFGAKTVTILKNGTVMNGIQGVLSQQFLQASSHLANGVTGHCGDWCARELANMLINNSVLAEFPKAS